MRRARNHLRTGGFWPPVATRSLRGHARSGSARATGLLDVPKEEVECGRARAEPLGALQIDVLVDLVIAGQGRLLDDLRLGERPQQVNIEDSQPGLSGSCARARSRFHPDAEHSPSHTRRSLSVSCAEGPAPRSALAMGPGDRLGDQPRLARTVTVVPQASLSPGAARTAPSRVRGEACGAGAAASTSDRTSGGPGRLWLRTAPVRNLRHGLQGRAALAQRRLAGGRTREAGS